MAMVARKKATAPAAGGKPRDRSQLSISACLCDYVERETEAMYWTMKLSKFCVAGINCHAAQRCVGMEF